MKQLFLFLRDIDGKKEKSLYLFRYKLLNLDEVNIVILQLRFNTVTFFLIQSEYFIYTFLGRINKKRRKKIIIVLEKLFLFDLKKKIK